MTPQVMHIPLLARAPRDVLFRTPDRAITAARFLRDAAALASALPERTHLLNLCQDRYHFTVSLAAAALRGQICLLSSDRSPEQLTGLAERFAHTGSLSEDPACTGIAGHHQLRLPAEEPRGDAPSLSLPAERIAAIVFTSGSTGAPVGNAKNWGALAARSLDFAARFGLVPGGAGGVVGTVPPQHMYGFETTALLPLHAPAASWSPAAFFPADIAAALAAMPSPRLLITTPLHLRALVQSGVALPPLAGIISATAPMDPALAAAAEQTFAAPVLEIFGATEVGSIASRRTLDGDVWTSYDTVRLTPGESGTLVSAPPAAPILLSDRLELLGPTRFRLLGRADDMIKLAGRRASLAGLTRILASLDGVTDAAFIVPDDLDRRPAARLLAFAVAPGQTPEALLAALRQRIDPVFLPRRVVLVAALPRNALGKLTRAAATALLAGAGAGGA